MSSTQSTLSTQSTRNARSIEDPQVPDVMDVLTARTYTHPALDGEQLVRLVPGALGEAEDLALDFLGLVRAGEPVPVGEVRQEALGFPAWALVNDPANGHHALALVKEIERLARQSKSKPGSAKDGFDLLAERLGRSVPHFLPTFWEQAGRIFLEQGNQTYAASFFGKAREAERVHGLAVDEDRLRAVFLEFALAGALSVKALRQYVKDLGVRLGGPTAWLRFRQLCVERSAAGMAPYAGLGEDAKSLLKAAGLDRDEASAAERALLADLLASPSIGRAPASFWTSWRPQLIALADADAGVRRLLLDILPTTPGEFGPNKRRDTGWLVLLTESGAVDLLTEPGAETGLAARWLTGWASHLVRIWHSGRSEATLELVPKLAVRLRADAVPVELFGADHRSSVQLDLLDLLLELEVPVKALDNPEILRVEQWLYDQAPGRRELALVAADPRFREPLRRSIQRDRSSSYSRNRPGEVFRHAPLRDVVLDWVDAQLELLRRGGPGLAGVRETLRGLALWRDQIKEHRPEVAAAIAAFDLAPVLGRTLRAGILDEFGWPALEQAMRGLLGGEVLVPGLRADVRYGSGREQGWLSVDEAWPALVLSNHRQAFVAGPEELLLVHPLRNQPKETWGRPHFRYVEGELLVQWQDAGTWHGYWSNRPTEVFAVGGQVPHPYLSYPQPISLPLPEGGRASGGRLLHAGDTALPEQLPLLGDGTGHWVLTTQKSKAVWTEYDPRSGSRGRASLPAFLAAAGREGMPVEPKACALLPMQPGLEHTPLGTDGTVLGRWVRRDGDRVEFGAPDGRTAALPTASDRGPVYPVGVLRFPGGAEVVVLRHQAELSLHRPGSGGGSDEALGSYGQYQTGGLHAAGTDLVPEVDFWHALRVRDEPGSLLLRSLTDDQAGALLAVARPQPHSGEEKPEWTSVDGARLPVTRPELAPVAEVAELFPEITHPGLRAGVAGIALAAVVVGEIARSFGATAVSAAKPAQPAVLPDPYRPEFGTDDFLERALSDALPGVHVRQWYWPRHEGRWFTLNQVRRVAATLEPAADGSGAWTLEPERLPSNSMNWLDLLGRPAPLLLRATAPIMTDGHRQALLLLLTELNAPTLAGERGPLRTVVLAEPGGRGKERKVRTGQVLRRGARTVVILSAQAVTEDQDHWLALDLDPTGAFDAIAHFSLLEERRIDHQLPAATVRGFVAAAEARGAYTWAPEAVADFAEQTGIGPELTSLLIAGRPPISGVNDGVLSTESMERLGTKRSRSYTVHSRLNRIEGEVQQAVMAALLPLVPEQLWTEGPQVKAAAAVWLERVGRVVSLPEELVAMADQRLLDLIEELLNHDRTPWLVRTTKQRMVEHTWRGGSHHALTAEDPSAVPSGAQITGSLVNGLQWLGYHLRYGDPLRARLPQALAAVRRRLADPELLLDLDLHFTEKGEHSAPALREALGLPEAGGADPDGLVRVAPALVLYPHHGGEGVSVRTGGLTGADDPVLALLEGITGSRGSGSIAALRTLLGPELERLVTAGVEAGPGVEPSPAPHHAQDAATSVPELVREVAAARGLSQDAAALYLQLLALPDPTDRQTARWTGWKPARLKAARAELMAADGLVAEAKRARAGRSLFLPGGWQESKAPGIPIETWKAALYPITPGAASWPQLPVPELFALAWQQVVSGHGPGYEALQTAPTRRKARR